MLRTRLHSSIFEKPYHPAKIGRLSLLERVSEGAIGGMRAAYDDTLDRKVAKGPLRYPSLPLSSLFISLSRLLGKPAC